MEGEVSTTYFDCPICRGKSESVYVTVCCNYFLCFTCAEMVQNQLKPCVFCQKQTCSCKKSELSLKAINQTQFHCKNGCGKIIQSRIESEHNKVCNFYEYACSQCDYKGKKFNFIQHFYVNHQDALLEKIEINYNEKKLESKELGNVMKLSKQDLINQVADLNNNILNLKAEIHEEQVKQSNLVQSIQRKKRAISLNLFIVLVFSIVSLLATGRHYFFYSDSQTQNQKQIIKAKSPTYPLSMEGIIILNMIAIVLYFVIADILLWAEKKGIMVQIGVGAGFLLVRIGFAAMFLLSIQDWLAENRSQRNRCGAERSYKDQNLNVCALATSFMDAVLIEFITAIIMAALCIVWVVVACIYFRKKHKKIGEQLLDQNNSQIEIQ